jgi:hypothetical protein
VTEKAFRQFIDNVAGVMVMSVSAMVLDVLMCAA